MYCTLDNMALPNIDIIRSIAQKVNIGCYREPAEISEIQPFIAVYLFVQINYTQCKTR